jgi:hypothetical protein
MLTEAALPPLYQSWLRAITAGPIPAETQATCDHCAMLPQGDNPPVIDYFHPSTKCCNYQPHLPNFLGGRILSDNDPFLAAGRQELEQRILKKVAVTPLRAGPGGVFAFIYNNAPDASQRAAELRCHFLTPAGACGIWTHRPAPCATWFCKHVRGSMGFQFWRLAGKLLLLVEHDLAWWCAAELKSGLTQWFNRDSVIVAHLPELGDELDGELYQRMWGGWAGRELNFYRACSRLVNPLSWEQVLNLCGPRVSILALLLHDAYTHLMSDAIPERLRAKEIRIARVEAGTCLVVTYSPLDPFPMPEALARFLHHFDGRPTDEALATILQEHDIRIDPAQLRRMVDFGILEDCDHHQQLLPILKTA